MRNKSIGVRVGGKQVAKQGQKKSDSNCMNTKTSAAIAVISSVLLVSACGGNGGDNADASNPNNTVAPVETIALDHMSDDELQRSAADGSKQMRSGISDTQSFVTRSDFIASMSDSDAANGLSELLGMTGENDDMQGSDSQSLATADPWIDAGVDGLIDLTLGLDGNADIARDGNSLYVDPDDAALCRHELLSENATAEEQQFCELMVSDLTVRIDGQTEDAGNIHYLYQDQALFKLSYAPGEASYKVHLDGLYLVIQKANSIDPMAFDDIPEVFSGVVELGMKINSDESGSMAFSISSPIAVVDVETGLDLNIEASDLLRFEHDDTLGTASIEVDAGASTLSFFDGNQFDFVSAGATMRIDLLDNGDHLSVSRLGLRNGPVTISIDSVEMIRMTLNTFGFDIDSAGAIKLTGALDFNVMLALMESVFDDGQSGALADVLNVNLSVGAPNGAKFTQQDQGAVKLEDAGPFNVDLSVSSNDFNDQQNFTVNAGECFAPGNDGNALFSQVVCQ